MAEERRARPLDKGIRPAGEEAAGAAPQRADAAHQGQTNVPIPPPMTDEQAAMDARIRLKQERGEPLDEQERNFLASLPADRQVWYQ